jgi:hypothetical protein
VGKRRAAVPDTVEHAAGAKPNSGERRMLRSVSALSSVRIIAAPRDENDVLDEDRARLAAWSPSSGWTYIEYADAFDLLAKIAAVGAIRIDEIEIVAHGNPAICDDITLDNVMLVGQSLSRLAGIGSTTVVYLSGCNTGLELNGDCLARSLADATGIAVFGARGYIAGTHAEGSEHCRASFVLDGILYHSYPGGADATGRDAWTGFGSDHHPRGGEHMQIKIATSGFRTVNLSGTQGQAIVAAVESAIRATPAQSARMRMAPDLRFAVRLADGERVFELLAGGAVLRDPVTRQVWQFESGPAILRELLPFRKLPAA